MIFDLFGGLYSSVYLTGVNGRFSIYLSISASGKTYVVVANVMDLDIVVSDFESQSYHYVLFCFSWRMTLEFTHKGWYAIREKKPYIYIYIYIYIYVYIYIYIYIYYLLVHANLKKDT